MENISIQKEQNKILDDILKIQATSLAVQVQSTSMKTLTEKEKGEGLTPAEQEFKSILEGFTKSIMSGKGGEDKLINRIKTLAPTADTETVTQLQGLLQSLLAIRGSRAKSAGIRAQETIAGNKLTIGRMEEQSAIRQKDLEYSLAINQAEQQRISILDQSVAYLTEESASKRKSLADSEAELNYLRQKDKLEIDFLTEKTRYLQAGELTEERLFYLEQSRDRGIKIAQEQKVNKELQNQQTLVQDTLKREQYLTQQKQKTLETEQAISNIYQDIELKALKDQLDLDKQRGVLTAQQLMNREATIRYRETELSYTKELAAIELEFRQKSLDLQNRINSISKDTPEGQAIRQGLEDEKAQEDRRRLARIAAITQTRDAQRAMNDEMAKYTDRQIQYGKVIEGTFDKMADALIEFARTGKLNFKELINSMIADLVRYELKLQMMEMYKAARPGLMSLIGSLFGTSSGGQFGVTPIGFSGYGGQGYIGGGAAKGAYFTDSYSNWATGASRFAKGGMFTNSIVDSPTLFKFAKGTGLMGEAGPEAIMPLKRDPQGNLGVRASTGDVQVVVNNYSQEKAQTRETTDSRGNRRIEVVVGDMAAGEVARGGSSTNRSMRNTFGLQPQLIRR